MKTRITYPHPVKLKSTDCPLCGEKAKYPYAPFCSRRCSRLDLGNWLNEAYVIPAHESDEDADLEILAAQAYKDSPLN